MTSLEALESLFLCSPAWMRSSDPWFRHWDKVPKGLVGPLHELRSDDLSRLRFDYVKPFLCWPNEPNYYLVPEDKSILTKT